MEAKQMIDIVPGWRSSDSMRKVCNLLLTNPKISIIVMMTRCKDILTTYLDETSGTR